MKLLQVSLQLLAVVSSLASTVPSYLPQVTPIPQDQCASVNASEPAECPKTLGPPCPPCYTNERRDYKSGDSVSFTADEIASLKNAVTDYVAWWNDNYPPKLRKIEGGYDMFSGVAGRGYLFLSLYQHLQSGDLDTIQSYAQLAESILPNTEQYPSYFKGFIGVWTLAAIVEDLKGNSAAVQQYQQKIIGTFIEVDNAITKGDSTSFRMDVGGIDMGLAGLLYNGLFVNEYFGSAVIDGTYLANVSYYLIELGLANGKKNGNDWLMYECPFIKDCYMWGMGHGNGGVLKMLFQAAEKYVPNLLTDDKYLVPITNTLNNLVSIQLPDGNMPTAVEGTCSSYYGTDPDSRVQWCHGAPGFVDVFTHAAVIYQNINTTLAQTYLNSGLRTANATWDRGLLVKGTMFCHGIGGNTFMLWQLYHNLNALQSSLFDSSLFDLPFLISQSAWRVKEFTLWTMSDTNMAKTRCQYDDSECPDYSMWQSCNAVTILYAQLMDDNWPNGVPACMPGWNLCL